MDYSALSWKRLWTTVFLEKMVTYASYAQKYFMGDLWFLEKLMNGTNHLRKTILWQQISLI